MGYVLRVRLASFFTGAATSSFVGLYILHRDYKVAQESITQQWEKFCGCEVQVKGLHDSLEQRISSLEKLKRN
ncbi:ABC transporter A family protein [Quillaja saponaria]|uniref:ABC transporter A family protein n=1 Tax=Quillaja saponaria TaxID=32244 RepID=A0AAD7PLR1_QUISA|nr:ABC transporter A family protein [Quillaja saponaria]